MYSYSEQQKPTLLGLVFFMKNSALPEHHVTAELCENVHFLIGELDRIHSPSLVKYPVLNTFIILSFFLQKFVSFLWNLASLTVFLGELYILLSRKMLLNQHQHF